MHRLDEKRLGVSSRRRTLRRVAGVANRVAANQGRQRLRREHGVDEANVFVKLCAATVGNRDTGSFLPAMLQREEAEERKLCALMWVGTIDGKDAAFVARVVVLNQTAGGHVWAAESASSTRWRAFN